MHKSLIYSFEKEILDKHSLDFTRLYEYTNVHKSLKGKKEFEALITDMFSAFKTGKCAQKNGNERILSYQELAENGDFQNSIDLKGLEYTSKEEVYFYFPTPEICPEAYKMYVIKDDEIISFFNYIYISEKKIRPFLFHNRLSKDDRIFMRL